MPSCEGLRGLAQQFRRGTAENQKACRQRLAVGQDAQYRKEIRAMLDFIDRHGTAQTLENHEIPPLLGGISCIGVQELE